MFLYLYVFLLTHVAAELLLFAAAFAGARRGVAFLAVSPCWFRWRSYPRLFVFRA